MKELFATAYNSTDYTDENVLYKSGLIDEITLSKGLTYLWGKDSEMFPLLSLTEGQGGISSIKPKTLNDTQYSWNVMGRMKHTAKVIGLANANNIKPGLGFTTFEVDFEDDWFKRYYSVTTPDKQHQLRIQGNPRQLSSGSYRYRLALIGGDHTEFVGLTNFVGSQNWVMGTPSVSASKSDGTSSNSMTPGKWTNQFGYSRFSKKISGNISNKVTNIEFDLDGGGTTNLWMPFEMKLFEIDRRLMMEDDLWNSKYNRDSNGKITLKDDENNEFISKGAGIKETLYTTGQYDTYGILGVNKLDAIVTRLHSNRVDDTPMEIVIYGGSGAQRMFNFAIKSAALNSSYYEKLGQEEVMSGKDGWLSYGKYFNQYKTLDGHIVTFKKAKIFDHGLRAELDRANGNMYDGLPAESYNMVFLDHSRNNNGERNIQLVAEKGREIITGVYKGLTNLPESWGAIGNGKLMSTRKDEASYEVLTSQGITMLNYTTSFFLEFTR